MKDALPTTASTVAVAHPDGNARSKAVSIELRRVARKARVVKPITSGGGGFQARRGDKIFRRILIFSFGALFLLPMFVSTVYLLFFAADQYVSETRFSIKSGDASPLENLAGLSSLLDTGAARDGLIIAEYVESRAMLDALSLQYDLRKIFSPQSGDLYAEFNRNESVEELLKYWRGQVHISVDRISGLVTLKVRTFSPHDSLVVSQSVIQLSEEMVNKLTRRNEIDALEKAHEEMMRSKSDLELAVTQLREARNAAGVLDVSVSAKVLAEIISTLRLDLSKVEQQISTLNEANSAHAPSLVALRGRAQALREQVSRYEGEMAGGGPAIAEGNLAERAQVLGQRELELKIAQSEYTEAIGAYEKARLTSERQRSYLQMYIAPELAEEALYPKRGVVWIALFASTLLLWGMFAGGALLVRDNTAV
ncbi:hypothetical protein [Ensifer adhaerens]|uniref:hypothetical protein n=1 Tax=Ensifer adhaerens TaxID=106592 RepID=UPI000FDA904A|nr:hypothetical protein [Ensifer adhaerens]MDF8358664.1 hypothetical protein [Ensifer adhaerens]THA59487.1 hypothetical protein E5176_31515 [Ensifer adhaerens]